MVSEPKWWFSLLVFLNPDTFLSGHRKIYSYGFTYPALSYLMVTSVMTKCHRRRSKSTVARHLLIWSHSWFFTYSFKRFVIQTHTGHLNAIMHTSLAAMDNVLSSWTFLTMRVILAHRCLITFWSKVFQYWSTTKPFSLCYLTYIRLTKCQDLSHFYAFLHNPLPISVGHWNLVLPIIFPYLLHMHDEILEIKDLSHF